MPSGPSRAKPEWRLMLRSLGNYLELDNDEKRGFPQPPLVKEAQSSVIIDLPRTFDHLVPHADLLNLFQQRRSHRLFTGTAISLLQLSYLLWNTQGIKVVKGNNYATLRTVPSAGARHALETYLIIRYVDSIAPGIYHYLPLTHQLERFAPLEGLTIDLAYQATQNRPWADLASVVFFWSATPYRMEWRYPDDAIKDILIDVGHVCQNLYLASEILGLGTCGIESYSQEKADQLFQLNGVDELIIYAAPVGQKVHRKSSEK